MPLSEQDIDTSHHEDHVDQEEKPAEDTGLVVPRHKWGAKKPRFIRGGDTVRFVLCTYTGGRPCFDEASCSVELSYLQDVHMRYPDNADIRFNFLIGGDGKVYEGRGWRVDPRVPKRFAQVTNKSLYLAFMGKFKFTPPTPKMFKAREELIKEGVRNGHINKKILLFTM